MTRNSLAAQKRQFWNRLPSQADDRSADHIGGSTRV
jgi:hypothetical protein